jgi:hypothetical protein
MKRLGYKQYVAQGGDWGAVVVDLLGVQAPAGLMGIHTNIAGIFPAEIDAAAFSGAPTPTGLSAEEKLAYERLKFVYQKGIATGSRRVATSRPGSSPRSSQKSSGQAFGRCVRRGRGLGRARGR